MTNRPIRLSEEEIQWIEQRRQGKKIPPAQSAKLEAKLAQVMSDGDKAKEKYAASIKLISELEARLNFQESLEKSLGSIHPREIKVPSTGKPLEATAVLAVGDWHTEERVDPSKVQGVNEYTPAIARRRVSRVFTDTVQELAAWRKRYHIKTLVLSVIGDMITGGIHDELMESNELSPGPAILLAYELLKSGIDYLDKEGGFDRIVITANYGNHGRTTKKSRISTGAWNSYEWLMYHFMRQQYADNKRIEWNIADGYQIYLNVYDTVLRVHHGDAIRYQDGVGGLTIPLHKAIDKWNTMKPATIDLLGHWHQSIMSRRFVVNGSLIGYGPFSNFIRAPFEPASQSLFLIRPEIGKTTETPLVVQNA